jgi:lipoyl(octanoyl) transferase
MVNSGPVVAIVVAISVAITPCADALSLSLSAAADKVEFEPLGRSAPRPQCSVVDTTLGGRTGYAVAWNWQKRLLEQKIANPALPDCALVVEHDKVVTLGTGSTLDNLLFDPQGQNAPCDVFRVERGGEATYHGPGQLLLYPILDLHRHRQDIHWYLRGLEEVVIRTVARMNIGLQAERLPGLTGVWINGHKVAAEGVKVSRWCTMHGLALNVNCESQDFRHIIPCGIRDRPVASLHELCSEGHLENVTMEAAKAALIASFAEVFELKLETASLSDVGLDSLSMLRGDEKG